MMYQVSSVADHSFDTLLGLFIMFVAAKLMAELFERLHQPAVIGEILAGVLIGPSLLNWVSPNEITNLLAEFGVIFLLFTVGLETKPTAIFAVGRSALLVAVLGTVAPFLGGWGLSRIFGSTNIESLFVGTSLVATSVGITARVLSGMGLLNATASRIILGAAVIDDIIGLLVLTVVTGAASGQVNLLQIAGTLVLVLALIAFVLWVASPMLKRWSPRLHQLKIKDAFYVVGIALCLGLAVAVSAIGVAAIIGAFFAGMALAEPSEGDHKLHHQVGGLTEFLMPFFLVNIGMQLNLSIFQSTSVIGFAAAVTLMAVLSKLMSGLGALSLGWRRALQVGVGMIPRGEVGIIVAQLGLSLGVISDALYGVVLFVAVATTLIAPPLLKALFANEPPVQPAQPDEFVRIG